MVYYVRFLKPPVLSELDKKTVLITSVLTVTTDLGDIALPSNVELLVTLVEAKDTDRIIDQLICQWQGGKRAVSVFQTLPKTHDRGNLRVHVSTRETEQCRGGLRIPGILDIWSSPFCLEQLGRSSSMVERQFEVAGNVCISIWEETGNTIARHIWDAAIGCLEAYQVSCLQCQELPNMPILTELLLNNSTKGKGKLNVVELGAGCGIAGIALAQTLQNCSVHLTDLPEAMEMLQKNVDIAKAAKGSSLSLGLLEWGPQLPDDLLQRPTDLMLISDCTYNADSCQDLVQTLLAFSRQSPDIKILVAMKRRHDAEALFEYKMESNGFEAMESMKQAVPHLPSEVEEMTPMIELYLYQYQKTQSA